jgi:hypothetical protein
MEAGRSGAINVAPTLTHTRSMEDRMSANTSLQLGTLLIFPITNACSNCQRQCGDDELSECLRCGARYCSCSWECQCDRDAVEILSRAEVTL